MSGADASHRVIEPGGRAADTTRVTRHVPTPQAHPVGTPARSGGLAAGLAARLSQPLAVDENRARSWVRYVRLGVVLSEVTAVVVAAYAVLGSRPQQAALLAVAAVVTVASPLLLALPVQRIVRGPRGSLLFYAWSVTLTTVISGVALLDGGASSPLALLLILTLTFAGLAFPPLGVALMGAVMVLAYLSLVLLAPHAAAPAGVTTAVLVLFCVMSWWAARNQCDTYDQQQLLAQRLAALAETDTLTGLANRMLFTRRLGTALEHGHRTGRPASLLLMDLNGFKEVNDRFGHPAGDALLQQVAARLSGARRASDTLARLGGDEYAVLLADVSDMDAVDRVAAGLAATFDDPFVVSGTEVRVTASIGVAVQGRDGDEPEELLRTSDAAMYAAKRCGGGVTHYDPARDDAARRLALLADLRGAIEHGQLRLHYQPSVRLRDGLVTGAEAFVRWQHPTRGLVAPTEVVPLAEQGELIAPLTAWVLEQAVEECRRWLDDGLDLCVAVNLSTRSILDEALPSLVRTVLRRHGLPPDRVVFEISETSLLARPEDAGRVLTELSGLGVNIAVDNFGSGYAALAWLQQLPFNALKIDRAFVADVTTGGIGAELVRYTAQLAHAMGKVVVAEGVESAEQWSALQQMGCDHAQDHSISAPLPPEEFRTWLEDWQDGSRSHGPDAVLPPAHGRRPLAQPATLAGMRTPS